MVVIVGVISDIDGVFILYDTQLFWKYHHTFGHSLVFGLPLILCLTFFSKEKGRFILYSTLAFGLHLLADIIGTNWRVLVLYPLNDLSLSISPHVSHSVIYGIIDPISYGVVLLIVFYYIFKKGSSPLEFLSLRWDRTIVEYYVLPMSMKCVICGQIGFHKCMSCQRVMCINHLKRTWRPMCKECAIEVQRVH